MNFSLTSNIGIVNQIVTIPSSALVISNLAICFLILDTSPSFLFSSKHRYCVRGLSDPSKAEPQAPIRAKNQQDTIPHARTRLGHPDQLLQCEKNQ